MGWNEYIWFALPALFFLILSAICAIKSKRELVNIFTLLAITIYSVFICELWLYLNYPPFHTIGEIRLWFSLFILVFALFIYNKLKYKYPLLISFLISGVFMIINIIKEELHVTALNPLLESHWYVPHVISYIISYSLLTYSMISAVLILLHNKRDKIIDKVEYRTVDISVYSGFILLIVGLLLGALWAYEAWGEFWSWDPKETWALITCLVYMSYIHIRLKNNNTSLPLWLLIIAYIALMITWIGIKYLPGGKDSLHNY